MPDRFAVPPAFPFACPPLACTAVCCWQLCHMIIMSCGDEEIKGDGEESEELHDLFCEIWERESQPELTFAITGVGSVRC